MPAEADSERRIWDLLVKDVKGMPPGIGITVHGGDEASEETAKLQIFEVAVAAILARLRPDYEWSVTPNLAGDSGLDFLGRNQFLENEALGIAAAITVGGQCKKRTEVGNIVEEISGSLTNMAFTYRPTFFVVALSNRLTGERIEEAQAKILAVYNRHCHILDRAQLEGLFQENLPVLDEILRRGLDQEKAEEILDYFRGLRRDGLAGAVTVSAPERVLAGVPFRVALDLCSPAASAAGLRLVWRHGESSEAEDRLITLIGPLGADGEGGVEFAAPGSADDPIRARCSLELITHSVGDVDLGEALIEIDGQAVARIELGSVEVVENVRPRFFARPVDAALTRLQDTYMRAQAGGVATVGVVGAGGSGKSRLCEEFALDRHRRGCTVVTARQAKVLDDPHRLLADLFAGLAADDLGFDDPADRVIQAIERYDPVVAGRAEPAIRAIFGTADQQSGTVTEQGILSSLLLLIAARSLRAPLIVHLQDLHWCGADVLLLLEKLVWQLNQGLAGGSRDHEASGVLLIFEGRDRERGRTGEGVWTSEPFEAFLQKLDCTPVSCAPFDPEDGLDFIRLLFEERHHAQRLVSDDLLELQHQLVERIFRTAGGNPFHSLEQVQLLKESGVLGQNPRTGLLYLIQPEWGQATLPDSIFDSIQLRWRYLKEQTPELALLVWAAALLEDRVPMELFQRLWEGIAPEVSLREVDATDMLWTGEGEAHEVAFRHEHYFRSVRRFAVTAEERERVVSIYSDWLSGRPNPSDRFRQARALLKRPEPDTGEAQKLMRSALRGARARGDLKLARRIAATRLDVAWAEELDSPARSSVFLRRCDDDIELIRELLGSDRRQAAGRLDDLAKHLDERISRAPARSLQARAGLQRRRIEVSVLLAQILFNDRKPARAAEVAAQTVQQARAQRPDTAAAGDETWETLEIEALHSQAAALALSGEIDEAIATSERAVEIARGSSSVLAHRVTSTYANILLARDPAAAEAILRDCLNRDDAAERERHATEINLGMALVLRAHSHDREDADRTAILAEAHALLHGVFGSCFQVGNYPNAGAAALMLGIVSALNEDGDDVSWFAQGVAAAARGRQMETLWRAHINLASAMHQRGDLPGGAIHDHAVATVKILEETLAPYSRPDRSARFELVRVPLAQAVRFLVTAGDDAGLAALERYPALRASFADPASGVLHEDRGDYRSHEWLRIGSEDYVIY
jgi:tetratricopeptide (TPR) repeat protein